MSFWSRVHERHRGFGNEVLRGVRCECLFGCERKKLQMSAGLSMMPWFPGDFMRSTRGWSVTARGVYRELLDAQWDMGGLPQNPIELAEMIGATSKEWAASWSKCESKFPIDQDGQRRNWTLESHRTRSLAIAERRAEAGRKGGRAAKGAQKQSSSPAQANDQAKPKPGSSKRQASSPVQSISISNPDQTIPEEPKNRTAAARPTVPIEFEDLQSIYPNRAGANPLDRALRACRARLKAGATWGQILDGAVRYQLYCRETHKIGTEFVMQLATFCGAGNHFLNRWDLPASTAEILRDTNLENSKEWLHATQ
jgi:uncharacterized protein YdaU (DUF1376 family)